MTEQDILNMLTEVVHPAQGSKSIIKLGDGSFRLD